MENYTIKTILKSCWPNNKTICLMRLWYCVHVGGISILGKVWWLRHNWFHGSFLGKHYSPWTIYSFVSFPSILNLVSAKLVNCCSFRDPVLEELYLELCLPLFRPRKEVNMCMVNRSLPSGPQCSHILVMRTVRMPLLEYLVTSQQHFIHLWIFKINICIRKPAQQSNKITVI